MKNKGPGDVFSRFCNKYIYTKKRYKNCLHLEFMMRIGTLF